jgi:hypothetical protein
MMKKPMSRCHITRAAVASWNRSIPNKSVSVFIVWLERSIFISLARLWFGTSKVLGGDARRANRRVMGEGMPPKHLPFASRKRETRPKLIFVQRIGFSPSQRLITGLTWIWWTAFSTKLRQALLEC